MNKPQSMPQLFISLFSISFILIFQMLSSNQLVFAADLTRGKTLYNGYCASCHGVSGDGKGPQGATLTPPPIDFTKSSVMSSVPYNINERAVFQGVPGTSMPGFGSILKPDEITDVIAYQRAFLK
jgi:mono/diheme cytochrome c family protein